MMPKHPDFEGIPRPTGQALDGILGLFQSGSGAFAVELDGFDLSALLQEGEDLLFRFSQGTWPKTRQRFATL